jgi:hypothetical protein
MFRTFSWSGVTSTGSQAIPHNLQWLDVARWEIDSRRIAAPVTYSGCFGAVRRRTVCEDWSLYLKVWWDCTKQPEWVIDPDGYDGIGVRLQIGDPRQLTAIQPGIFLPYYIADLAVWSGLHFVSPEEGDEDGIVWAEITFEGDSLLWFISDQQDNLDWYYNYTLKLGQQGFLINNDSATH